MLNKFAPVLKFVKNPPTLREIAIDYGYDSFDFDYDDENGTSGVRYNLTGATIRAYAGWAGKVLAMIVCAFKGHNLTNATYAGASSAAEITVCRRCGSSWHYRYY